MPSVKINGNEVTYTELGSGDETFIYVSSEGVNYGVFEEMLTLFPSDYHFYLIQLPLHEQHISNKDFPITKQWGDDVYKFSQAIGLKKFNYMGISRWGQVGYQLVLHHPEVVKAFIPLVSVPIPTQQRIDPGVLKALEKGDIKAQMESSERDMFCPTTDKERLARRERWRQTQAKHIAPHNPLYERDLILRLGEARIDTYPRLSEIKVPTLVFFGDKDPTNPIDQAVIAAMTIPGAKAVFFQGYAHLLTIEAPDKVVNEIVLFINELNKKK